MKWVEGINGVWSLLKVDNGTRDSVYYPLLSNVFGIFSNKNIFLIVKMKEYTVKWET